MTNVKSLAHIFCKRIFLHFWFFANVRLDRSKVTDRHTHTHTHTQTTEMDKLIVIDEIVQICLKKTLPYFLNSKFVLIIVIICAAIYIQWVRRPLQARLWVRIIKLKIVWTIALSWIHFITSLCEITLHYYWFLVYRRHCASQVSWVATPIPPQQETFQGRYFLTCWWHSPCVQVSVWAEWVWNVTPLPPNTNRFTLENNKVGGLTL